MSEQKHRAASPVQWPLQLEKHTKIVATVGPAIANVDTMKTLIESGVSVFRLNCSHSSEETLGANIWMIREAGKLAGRHPAILADLQGPKFRLGDLEDHKPVMLKEGDIVRMVTGVRQKVGNASVLTTGTEHAHVCIREVHVGHRVMINDGAVVLRVKERIDSEEVVCQVEVGGEVGEHKGINVPDLAVSTPALTDKDIKDALFCLECDVDFMALSFVQRAMDIVQLQKLIANAMERGKARSVPLLIAKIEKPQAMDCIDDILSVADGLMVARGDMGVECPIQTVPSIQKLLIKKCNMANKLIITATQMLESMTNSPMPTRAEVSDVANAVYDGTDAVMLSGETSVGKYPIKTVQMMSSVCTEAERQLWSGIVTSNVPKPTVPANTPHATSPPPTPTGAKPSYGLQVHATDFSYAVAEAAVAAAAQKNMKAIVLVVTDFSLVVFLSKLRPACPIIAVTFSEKIANHIALVSGVSPILMPQPAATITSDSLLVKIEKAISERGWLQDNDAVVFCAAGVALPGLSDSLSLRRFGRATKQHEAFQKWSMAVRSLAQQRGSGSAVDERAVAAHHHAQLAHNLARFSSGSSALDAVDTDTLFRRSVEFAFIGAPGAGKTIICQKLMSELPVALGRAVTVATVNPPALVRALLADQGAQGADAKRAAAAGGAVLDSFTAKTAIAEIKNLSTTHEVCLLNSFPSTHSASIELAKQNLAICNRIRLVFVFDLPLDEALRRLSGRLVHVASGRTYHVTDNPPRVEGKDDLTGEPLSQLEDDQDATVRKRTQVHLTQSPLVRQFFESRGVRCVPIDAQQPLDTVFASVLENIKAALTEPLSSPAPTPFTFHVDN